MNPTSSLKVVEGYFEDLVEMTAAPLKGEVETSPNSWNQLNTYWRDRRPVVIRYAQQALSNMQRGSEHRALMIYQTLQDTVAWLSMRHGYIFELKVVDQAALVKSIGEGGITDLQHCRPKAYAIFVSMLTREADERLKFYQRLAGNEA